MESADDSGRWEKSRTLGPSHLSATSPAKNFHSFAKPFCLLSIVIILELSCFSSFLDFWATVISFALQ